MRPSTRFVPHVAALSLLAAAFVWSAWVSPDRTDPCAHPDVLKVTGLIPGAKPEGERKERLGGDVVQWSEGLVTDPERPREPLAFRIVRTYSALKGAERPLGLMPSKLEPESIRASRVEAPGGPLTVHLVRTTGGTEFHVVAYVFLLGNDPVSHPFPAQLRHAVRDPLEGSLPLTILLAGGAARQDNADARERLAVAWVSAAWEHYRAMCLPPQRPGTQ